MRIALLVVVCVAAVLVAHSALLADGIVSVWSDEVGTGGHLSWYGNSGLILTPSAVTSGQSSASINWHQIQRDDTIDVANINFGFRDMFEIGGSYLDGGAADGEFVGNAKLRLPLSNWLDNPNAPQVAIGGVDFTNELNSIFYIVLTKPVQFGEGAATGANVLFNLGYGRNDMREGSMDGIFAGLSFAGFKNTTVEAEYDGDAFNADLRWKFNERFGAEIGILDGDFGYGISFTSSR